MSRRKNPPRLCAYCGGPTKKQAKYCCREHYLAEMPKLVKFRCEWCNNVELVEPWRVKQGRKYCSKECKAEAMRK